MKIEKEVDHWWNLYVCYKPAYDLTDDDFTYVQEFTFTEHGFFHLTFVDKSHTFIAKDTIAWFNADIVKKETETEQEVTQEAYHEPV
jgi:hypothetical protein